jgi:hypothetical protein
MEFEDFENKLSKIIFNNEERINNNDKVNLLEINKLINSIEQKIKSGNYDLVELPKLLNKVKVVRITLEKKISNYNIELKKEKELQHIITINKIKEKKIKEVIPKKEKIKKEEVVETATDYAELPIIGFFVSFLMNKYKVAKENNEQHIFLLTIISSLIMLVGIYWGVDYIIEKGYFSINVRTVIGFSLSFVMLYFGNKILSKEILHGLNLLGVGIFSFYGLYYFSLMYYDFINLNLGFLFIVLSSLLLFYYSGIKSNSTIFIISLLATATIPLYFSNIDILSSRFSIFNYYQYESSKIINFNIVLISTLLLCAFSTFILIKNKFKNSVYLSFLIFTSIIISVFNYKEVSGILSLFSLLTVYIIYVFSLIVNEDFKLVEVKDLKKKSVIFIFSLFMFFMGSTLYLMEIKDISELLLLAVLALLVLVLSVLSFKIQKTNELLFSVLILKIISIISIIGFYYFSEHIEIILLIESVSLIFLGYKNKINLVKIEGLLLLLSVFISGDFITNGYNFLLYVIPSLYCSLYIFNYKDSKTLKILEYAVSITGFLSVSAFFNQDIVSLYYIVPFVSVLVFTLNKYKKPQIICFSVFNLLLWVALSIEYHQGFILLDKLIVVSFILYSKWLIVKNEYSEKVKTISDKIMKVLLIITPFILLSSCFKHLSGDLLSVSIAALFIMTFMISKYLPERYNFYNLKKYYVFNSMILLALLFVIHFTTLLIPLYLSFVVYMLFGGNEEINSLSIKFNIEKIKENCIKVIIFIIPLSLIYTLDTQNIIINLITSIAIINILFFALKDNFCSFVEKYNINDLFIFEILLLVCVLIFTGFNNMLEIYQVLSLFSLSLYFSLLLKIIDIKFIKNAKFLSNKLFSLSYFATPFILCMLLDYFKIYDFSNIVDLSLVIPLLLSLIMLKNKKLINITFIQILLLSFLINVNLFYIALIILLLTVKNNGIISKHRSKLYLILFFTSPLLLIFNLGLHSYFKSVSFGMLMPILIVLFNYSLIGLVWLSDSFKNANKVLLTTIYVIIFNIIYAVINGNEILVGLGLTLLLLIPLIYSFIQVVLKENKDYNKTYYILLIAFLIKLFLIDIDIAVYSKEMVIIFGIILFALTFVVKKLKNNQKK